MNTAPSTDTSLWTTRPVYGVAGGPMEVVLTEEGRARAFSVGAKVRRGQPAEALLVLSEVGGSSNLNQREGRRMALTTMGRTYSMPVWGVLVSLEYVEQWHDNGGDGVRLTDAGRTAVANGIAEQERLLARCRRAASK